MPCRHSLPGTTPKKTSNLQVGYVYLPPMNPASGIYHAQGAGDADYFGRLRVCVMVEEERYRVEQGDCIVFDANIEHVMYTEEQPATFVIISSPPYGQNILPTHE